MAEKKYIIDSEELMAEWDWEKNNELGLNPNQITYGSNKKAWWKCRKGHSWETSISARAKQGHQCVYCSNQKALKGYNDFETFCKNNALLYLLQEWDYDNNANQPEEYTWCSGQKVYWRCNKGHSWKTSIAHRITENTGCPVCSNKKVLKGYNDLKTLCPIIAGEWHPTKNGDLTPDNVSIGSSKRVWWICKDGHEWQAAIYSRTGKNGTGCAVCSGKKLYQGLNDLETYCKSNKELLYLLDEWDYDKNKCNPNEIARSSSKKVFWKCIHGHKWAASVSSRVRGNNCRICNSQTSFPEQAIFYYISSLFPNSVNRYVFDKTELDIFIPELSIGIEYDGFHFHNKKSNKEVLKNQKCIDNGIKLIRIRENGLTSYNDCICIFRQDNFSNEALSDAINELLRQLGKPVTIDVNKDKAIITKQYKQYVLDNSITSLKPELLLDWDEDSNGGLMLENFTKGSHYKAHWKCHICGYEWDAEIKSRFAGSGCIMCSMKKFTQTRSIKVLNVETSAVYTSLTDAERKTNIERHSISDCCKGKRDTAGGYHWKFID